MAKFAVIKSGGKQFLVSPDQEIVVDKVDSEEKTVDLEVLATFDDEKGAFELGTPSLKNTIKATVVEAVRGEKIRVARFKSKVRYRKIRGSRSQLTKIRIGDI